MNPLRWIILSLAGVLIACLLLWILAWRTGSEISRDLTLPPMDPKKLPDAIRYEIEHHFPLPASQLCRDCHRVEEPSVAESARKGHQIGLVAVKRAQVETLLGRCDAVGWDVDVVQVDYLAACNAVGHEAPDRQSADGPDEEPPGLSALLDVGGDASSLIVPAGCSAWYRGLGVGSHSFVRALVKELKVPLSEAELLLQDPTRAERISRVEAAFRPVFEDLVEEIRLSLEAFAKAHPGRKVERILGIGGGFQMHGLLRYLRWGR